VSLDTRQAGLVAKLSSPYLALCSVQFPSFDLVHVAPHPRLTWLNRPDERMMHFVKMLRGMLVLRGITAPHMPARKTQAQVNPGIPSFHALFANVLVRASKLDLIQMRALTLHGFSKRRRWLVK
jgi:hypothetical protein